MQPLPELQAHPRLAALIARARADANARLPRIGLVYPCDALALDAAQRIAASGIGQPVLVGPHAAIAQAAASAGVDLSGMAQVDTADTGTAAALEATRLARNGQVDVLMKGSLHTDELMSAVVHKENGLRGERRISHVFLFDLPHYPKLLAMADCVVNIAPDLRTKQDILGNAIALLQKLGNPGPRSASWPRWRP